MISQLTNSRLRDCANLYAETFNSPPWNESWSIDDALQRLEGFLNTPHSAGVYLTQPDDELIGFALGHLERSADGDHSLLQEMAGGL
ncbi:hypothetical protein [Actinopolymorpha alba]|uniref:hypothetical protein n=1 Tax=Actinopolymorpha alba TaxID=533267 RepID=UPI00037EA860|nr:hypothetical protein [Actinopolymorpha alba]